MVTLLPSRDFFLEPFKDDLGFSLVGETYLLISYSDRYS